MQAGLAAAVALDPTRGAAENAEAMNEALANVRTGAVTGAARDDAEGRFRRGEAVGFVDEQLVAWGEPSETLEAVLGELGREAELLTLIEGDGAPLDGDGVAALVPGGVDVEYSRGDQPAYWWLASTAAAEAIEVPGLILFITHPEVRVDRSVPVPDWGLSDRGRERMRALTVPVEHVRAIWSSAERKAVKQPRSSPSDSRSRQESCTNWGRTIAPQLVSSNQTCSQPTASSPSPIAASTAGRPPPPRRRASWPPSIACSPSRRRVTSRSSPTAASARSCSARCAACRSPVSSTSPARGTGSRSSARAAAYCTAGAA